MEDKNNCILIILISLIIIIINARIELNNIINKHNDKEIVRCVQNENYKFKVEGRIITCVDK